MKSDINRAIQTLINTLYFADSSDYRSGMWDALNALCPDAAKLIANGEESKAFDKYCE